MNKLLSRSAELEDRLLELMRLPPLNDSDRITASRIMCSIAFEHAQSVKILLAGSNVTSAIALVRLQYEALVRALWILYAAPDNLVTKLTCELTQESANKANKIPMLAEMLKQLHGKMPQEPLDMLLEFKEYSWKPLCSFVHTGMHAIHRHSAGYPTQLVEQVVKISNGVSLMVGQLLVILHGVREQQGKIPCIQQEFADCLPPQNVQSGQDHKQC